jgi:hypothetical protein
LTAVLFGAERFGGPLVAGYGDLHVQAGPASRARRRAGGRQEAVSTPDDRQPPDEVSYRLDEALDLLAALEDARDTLIDAGRLAVVVVVEAQIRLLSRRLGFDDPPGGSDAR